MEGRLSVYYFLLFTGAIIHANGFISNINAFEKMHHLHLFSVYLISLPSISEAVIFKAID